MNLKKLFIANGFLEVSGEAGKPGAAALGTILSNLATYGYAPNKEAVKALSKLSDAGLAEFWKGAEPALKAVTGSDRNMDEFVVYKNFPKETLEMSAAQYWVAQVLMYQGLPNELFTQDVEEREPLGDRLTKLKVLGLADPDVTPRLIYQILLSKRARWTDEQKLNAVQLFDLLQKNAVDITAFGFRENGVTLAAHGFEKSEIVTNAATDVIRVAAALSGGDISLRTKFKFKKFNRADRQRLLRVLETCKMDEDMALRPGQWKKLLRALRPGDYKNAYPKTVAAYDTLYNGEHSAYQSRLESQMKAGDPQVFQTMRERPGVFARRLHESYGKFGRKAFEEFKTVVPDLDNQQLTKLDRYVGTISGRQHLMYPPGGNWARVQVVPNKKAFIREDDAMLVRTAINTEVSKRLRERYPEGFSVDPELCRVKLQTNDQKLAAYGRGTEFDIPDGITFVRSASYWENKSVGYVNTWFDNGWNFFDENWKAKGACCWSGGYETQHNKAAVFSGDPTNSKDLKGRACQMIDLYLDKLEEAGVRYCVWNVLCYSNVKFSDATDVLATLQMGEKAERGKLYEPARAQMIFPLKSEALTSYVAYIDLKRRKLIYMDAPLKGAVHSAASNSEVLEAVMPAYVEYLDSLPSVADLLANNDGGTIPALYSDKGVDVKGRGFVFRRENDQNTFTPIDITELIG